MKPLRERSIHELRGIAQSFGVHDIFEKDVLALAQEIELKQEKMAPAKVVPPPAPAYDARLMTLAPNEQASPAAIVEMLKGHIVLGLRLELTEENWSMSLGLKTDSGTMRMPLNTILRCADKLLK